MNSDKVQSYSAQTSQCSTLSFAMPALPRWNQMWIHFTRALLGVAAPTRHGGRTGHKHAMPDNAIWEPK